MSEPDYRDEWWIFCAHALGAGVALALAAVALLGVW